MCHAWDIESETPYITHYVLIWFHHAIVLNLTELKRPLYVYQDNFERYAPSRHMILFQDVYHSMTM